MPLYMTQFSYSAEAWAALARKPENRKEAVSRLCQQLGGRLSALYYCFGEYDGVLIAEAPDEVTVTAILISAIAPGHVRATKTTVLLTPEQAVEAMRRAGGVTYRAPGGPA
jgi:uncharacterized protein with GYD domain